MIEDIKKDADMRMGKSIEAFRHELGQIRTGRAHTSLLASVTVDYYGAQTPLTQVANVNVEDARTLTVNPWEKNLIGAIEKAILNSGLGLNPASTGTVIRVPLPPLTEERRRDLIKVVRNEGEGAKVAIRNIRRDANADIKELVKEKEISEDDGRRGEDAIQKITDGHVAEVDKLLEVKEQELMEF
ncbi:MAG: ribosome recycling factor [Gammaproteobacteria bacterium]|nr:ribosome recycling factor [Gammaproteobacteria bacterium]MCP5135313.1 ribosome recycling factor [Gammaproteobacteria bacterium]